MGIIKLLRKNAPTLKKIFKTKTAEQTVTKMSTDKKEKKAGKNNTLKDVGKIALKTTVISGAVLGGTALVLPAIGFTASGVAAGSLAASFQSAYLGGTIASGSVFATLQSAGVLGLAASTKAAVVSASAALSGLHSAWSKKRKRSDNDSAETSENSEKYAVDEAAIEENSDNEDQEKINVNNDFEEGGGGSTINDDTRKDKKVLVRFDAKHGNDDASKSLKLNAQPPKIEDEIDSLRKKWENVELSKDVTITQHLVKKKKLNA